MNLDAALARLREVLVFWQREAGATVSDDDHRDSKAARGRLNQKVAEIRSAVAELEDLIARLQAGP